MANDTEAAAQVINGQVEPHVISSAEDEAKLVRDAVRALPSHAVKEHLSMGVRSVPIFLRVCCLCYVLNSTKNRTPSWLDDLYILFFAKKTEL